ncbi:MAG: hypothetical protein J2P37_25480, partial [Ktedonobacteraceae bacterium]|nr:hypothetical protein [Ktedonobacteraceae bacterium]
MKHNRTQLVKANDAKDVITDDDPCSFMQGANEESMWQQYLYVDTHGNYPYFVYTPETYQVSGPVPLVIMLHGCTQTAADFATGTSMNLLAEQHGFVLLYPQQTSSSNYKRCWNWFLPANQQRGSGEPARIVGMAKSLLRNT